VDVPHRLDVLGVPVLVGHPKLYAHAVRPDEGPVQSGHRHQVFQALYSKLDCTVRLPSSAPH
jgi:hypothetical protein